MNIFKNFILPGLIGLFLVLKGYSQTGSDEMLAAADLSFLVGEDFKTDSLPFPQSEVSKSPAGFRNSNYYFGGYINVNVGRYTVVGAEPLIGYKFSPKFSVGGKLSYEYIRDKRYDSVFETSNFGAGLFSRYRIIPALYTHAEFSLMNYKLSYTNGESQREWVPFLFLGGGYSQPVSQNVWFNAQILFDVLQHKNSPYKEWEPFYSVGFGVGF